MKDKNISRRSFLKYLGLGSAAAVAACAGRQGSSETESPTEPPVGQMTYRKNPKNGDQVSLLG